MSVCQCEGACCCLLVRVLLASEKALDRVERGPRGEGEGEGEGERGWNNKGWWKMTSFMKEGFLKAPHLTEKAVPCTRNHPPLLLTPGCPGRADTLKPLTAAPWVGMAYIYFYL